MGVRYTSEQIKNLKIMQVDGVYRVPAGRQMAKVEPLGNLIARAIPELSETSETGGKIYIKPLSTNKAWKGRRFKTDEHNKYCEAVALLLPKGIVIPDGFLKITYEFGFSNSGADLDNPLKTMQDLLSKQYGFNDNRIMIAVINKVIVKKGNEYISFKIESLNK